MSVLLPFRALRPSPSAAARVASVPYDVVNADEARALAAGNPLSFLRVTRSEIDLASDVPPYDDRVYARASQNLAELTAHAPLVRDEEPSIYLYRLHRGAHRQTGVAGLFSIDEYDRGLIKRHEKTRKDKEDDRTRHIVEVGAQTGVVFLTHRASPAVRAVTDRATRTPPLYDLTAADGVRHEIWRVTGDDASAIAAAFAAMPAQYIADGHHRAASAARARDERRRQGRASSDSEHVLAVSFQDDEVDILPYNRTVKDLAGQSPEGLMAALRSAGLDVRPGSAAPDRTGAVSMFLGGGWHALTLPAPPRGTPRADALDVEVLQRQVLEPHLRVGDPRTDKRIDFVGGIRGTGELEHLVSSGKAAVAFSMYPVSIADLMAIADAGGIMPPKSTWFEPKLRDGLLIHVI